MKIILDYKQEIKKIDFLINIYWFNAKKWQLLGYKT